MRHNKLFGIVFVLAAAIVMGFYPTTASAYIVHHCTYDPSSLMAEIHDRHSYENGCGNLDSTGDGHDGHCDISTGFYWAEMDCYGGSCSMAGTIDCPGGDKSYSFECPGDSSDRARVEQDRYSASCDSPEAGQDHSCTCSGPCS